MRTALRVDGWSTGSFGVAMLGGALALLLIAGSPGIPFRQACGVVGVNALSAVGMVVLTVSGLIELTGLGVAFMVVGATVVAVFAAVEFVGLRRAGY